MNTRVPPHFLRNRRPGGHFDALGHATPAGKDPYDPLIEALFLLEHGRPNCRSKDQNPKPEPL